MADLVALHAGGQPAPWESIGLRFDGSLCYLGDVSLQLTPDGVGLTGWTINVGRDDEIVIDGIPTFLTATPPTKPDGADIGGQKIVGLDHVVVMTDDLDRTCEAVTQHLGLEVRRERDAGRGVVQRFIKLSNTIIEVVTGPHVQTSGASLWGMVISVDDMVAWATQCGEEVTSTPKQATQPGRLISTVRSSVGLGVPFAVMTPHVPSDGSDN